MMSEQSQTLFLFEFLVEFIRLDKSCKVSSALSLGLRLLDFPTVCINQHQGGVGTSLSEQKYEDNVVQFNFNRGKSCFFKTNLDSLNIQLSVTPLHAMVLDMMEDHPRLVGSSLISLVKAMNKIMKDVTKSGISTPSSHEESGLAAICNLVGERIGTISLSYKLVCLGASLLPRVTERRGYKSMPGGQQQEHNKEKSSPSELDIQTSGRADARILLDEDKLDDGAVCDTVKNQFENDFQEDLTIFCPPHLYYSNASPETSNDKQEYKLPDLNPEDFLFEDFCSEEEVDKNKDAGPSCKREHEKVACAQKTSNSPETSGVTPNIFRDALKHLPLLNALVTELVQLAGETHHQSVTVNPSQAQIYKPASSEPSGHENTHPSAQSLRKTRQHTGTRLKHLQPPRNCSTPIVKGNQQEETLTGKNGSSKSHRKTLVYGTTKTYHLRLKQVSLVKAKPCECVALSQRETQARAAKVKTKSSSKTVKSSRRKTVLNKRPGSDEDIETAVQHLTEDAALQSTVTLKLKDNEQDGKVFLPHKDLKLIHIPSVETESISQSKNKHHRESDQSDSQSDKDKFKRPVPTSTEKPRSQHGSPESSFSESSVGKNENADYADDFDSLDSSDASPKPASSPESTRTKTPKSPVSPDLFNSGSRSKSIQHRPVVLPVPVKALGSPQRSLMRTHTLKPHTHSSAFSYDDDDERDKPASLQTVCSRKQTTAGDNVEQSSFTEIFSSSRCERIASPGNHCSVQGFSVESVSSFEAQDAEELEDELGSLDFRKEYQHISELVATKLPGYTM
nr:microtubule-associated protein 10 [Nothobranchius furzeri]